ncbi:ABC transporter permease [Agrobacterium salinitolerans]|nr:ABC transporter permease [Agrobacterium salinitolerans]
MKSGKERGVFKDLTMLRTLVRREFSIRYRDSFLGFLWIFASPLLMIATYSLFMFGVVRNLDTGTRVSQGHAGLAGLWVCLGLWQWLAEGTNRAAVVAHENAAMVKKTPVKLALLPLTNVIVSSIGFLLPLVGGVALITVYGNGSESFPLLLLGLVSLLPWFVGVAFFATVVGTFVRDTKHALPICFNVGLFLSPILYSREQAPTLLADVLALNPLGYHFELIQYAVGGQQMPDVQATVFTTGLGLVFCFASLRLFSLRSGEFSDVV